MSTYTKILYQIVFSNGVEDHLHIATHIHPAVALSPLVKDIKLGSSYQTCF